MYTELGNCPYRLCYMVEFNRRHEWYFSSQSEAEVAADKMRGLFHVEIFRVEETEKDGKISKEFTKLNPN